MLKLVLFSVGHTVFEIIKEEKETPELLRCAYFY
jgi:hypothetical protein